MKKALFTLDCSENVYNGFTDGSTWNGWFMPWLPLSEVQRFLSLESFPPDCGPRFVWEGSDLIELSEDGERDSTPVKIIDGLLCYQLGNGWVWDLAK